MTCEERRRLRRPICLLLTPGAESQSSASVRVNAVLRSLCRRFALESEHAPQVCSPRKQVFIPQLTRTLRRALKTATARKNSSQQGWVMGGKCMVHALPLFAIIIHPAHTPAIVPRLTLRHITPPLPPTDFNQRGHERKHRTSFDVPPPNLPSLLPLCNRCLVCSNSASPAQFPI